MINIENKTKPNKWKGHPIIPITAFGIVAVVGLSIAVAFNYTMNSIHLNKSGLSKRDAEFFSLFFPGDYSPMYKGEFEKAIPGYKLKSEKNKNVDPDSTEFIYRK